MAKYTENMCYELKRMKNLFSDIWDFYFSSYGENSSKVDHILSTKMAITRRIKNVKLIFHSFQHNPHLSCKFYLFRIFFLKYFIHSVKNKFLKYLDRYKNSFQKKNVFSTYPKKVMGFNLKIIEKFRRRKYIFCSDFEVFFGDFLINNIRLRNESEYIF